MTLAVITGRSAIAEVFFGEATDARRAWPATLLLVGATFFITDGIQTVAAGALRGMNDTRVPLLFATISYWLIGFHARLALGVRTPLGASRRLDRAVVRHGGLCRPARLAFPPAREQTEATMKVHEIAPDVDPGPLLAGAQFIDAYRVAVGGHALDARTAAEKMFGALAALDRDAAPLRNLVVAPFGLKTSGRGEPATGGMVGIFPVVSETPERLVAGFNDHHLDFRVVVDVALAWPAGHHDHAGDDP